MAKSSVESHNWSTQPGYEQKTVKLVCNVHGNLGEMNQEWAGKAHREHLDIFGDDCIVTMINLIQVIGKWEVEE